MFRDGVQDFPVPRTVQEQNLRATNPPRLKYTQVHKTPDILFNRIPCSPNTTRDAIERVDESRAAVEQNQQVSRNLCSEKRFQHLCSAHFVRASVAQASLAIS